MTPGPAPYTFPDSCSFVVELSLSERYATRDRVSMETAVGVFNDNVSGTFDSTELEAVVTELDLEVELDGGVLTALRAAAAVTPGLGRHVLATALVEAGILVAETHLPAVQVLKDSIAFDVTFSATDHLEENILSMSPLLPDSDPNVTSLVGIRDQFSNSDALVVVNEGGGFRGTT
jgi:hypothetical protein